MKKTLKNLAKISILIISILLVNTISQAAEYAYSIGSNFDSSCGMAGDFTANVRYAANQYMMRSDITSSYYSTEPTYSYMRGNNANGFRRIGSKIVFMNGHADTHRIVAVAHNNSTYRTGIYTGYDTTIDGYTYAGLQSTNMNNVWLITFAGCTTAGPTGATDSLIDIAYNRGADYAVGFDGEIYSRDAQGPEWLQIYNVAIGNGESVRSALTKACTAYPNCSMSQHMRNRGIDERTTFSSSNILSTNKGFENAGKQILTEKIGKETIEENYQLISNKKIKLRDDLERIDKQPLNNYKDQFNELIDEIKKYDTAFNINNYKVIYKIYNPDSNLGYISFIYYIDGDIETNKVYLAQIENGTITNITLAGILKDNIDTININENNIKAKRDNFNNNKVTEVKNKQKENANLKKLSIELDENNAIKKSALAIDSNVKNISEKYYYDYNTKELKYILGVIMKDIYGTFDGEALEITL